MNILNTNKTALTVGLFLGGWHLLWSILIALGIAQPLYDFILWAHMVHMQILIGPFELKAAILLVIATFIIGYVFGWIFATIWNKLHARA